MFELLRVILKKLKSLLELCWGNCRRMCNLAGTSFEYWWTNCSCKSYTSHRKICPQLHTSYNFKSKSITKMRNSAQKMESVRVWVKSRVWPEKCHFLWYLALKNTTLKSTEILQFWSFNFSYLWILFSCLWIIFK